MQNFLSRDALQTLSDMDIDGVEPITFSSDDAVIIKDNKVGLWSGEHGLILDPIYDEIMDFRDSDLIRVGKRVGGEILFGAYCKKKKRFVMRLKYTNHEFWRRFQRLK